MTTIYTPDPFARMSPNTLCVKLQHTRNAGWLNLMKGRKTDLMMLINTALVKNLPNTSFQQNSAAQPVTELLYLGIISSFSSLLSDNQHTSSVFYRNTSFSYAFAPLAGNYYA